MLDSPFPPPSRPFLHAGLTDLSWSKNGSRLEVISDLIYSWSLSLRFDRKQKKERAIRREYVNREFELLRFDTVLSNYS